MTITVPAPPPAARPRASRSAPPSAAPAPAPAASEVGTEAETAPTPAPAAQRPKAKPKKKPKAKARREAVRAGGAPSRPAPLSPVVAYAAIGASPHESWLPVGDERAQAPVVYVARPAARSEGTGGLLLLAAGLPALALIAVAGTAPRLRRRWPAFGRAVEARSTLLFVGAAMLGAMMLGWMSVALLGGA